jgi:hypothetical protein
MDWGKGREGRAVLWLRNCRFVTAYKVIRKVKLQVE